MFYLEDYKKYAFDSLAMPFRFNLNEIARSLLNTLDGKSPATMNPDKFWDIVESYEIRRMK